MSFKLTLKTGNQAGSPADGGMPPTPGSASATPSTGKPKVKLNFSQPPTPATEQPPSVALSAGGSQATKEGSQPKGKKAAAGGGGGGGKKRAANDDSISPAPKRPNKAPAPTRKFSLKVGPVAPQPPGTADQAPPSAGGAQKLLLRRKSTQPVLRNISVKRPPPPRVPGHGYDSEDSEAEADPAIQQAFVLRMEPGEDCEYLREAIAKNTIGLAPHEGGAQVSIRFIERDNKRAIVTVRGRMYAAVLVELPCIVETMKSWDKRGWWKVADLSQMLLVLGRCGSEEEARNFRLPSEVEKNNLHYPHGLTPPMRWVRKRRFRKRLSYKTIANVEEEVDRLLKEDEAIEREGGEVNLDYFDRRSDLEPSEQDDDGEDDEDDEEGNDALETTEMDVEQYSDEGDADLEGNLQAMFDEEGDAAATADIPAVSSAPLPDQAASFAAVSSAMATNPTSSASPSGAAIETPAEATTTQDEQSASREQSPNAQTSSEEDESEDDSPDSPDVMDEDALAQQAERNQQLEELADLQREVEAQRAKVANTKNQLLKERAAAQLRTLEEDERVKKAAIFGDRDGDEGEERDD